MMTHTFSLSAVRHGAALGAALLVLAMLAGCGFHLQGTSPLPQGIKAMHVSFHSNYRVGEPPLVSALKQRLRRQHLLGDRDAPAELHIVSVKNRRRTMSISPVNGDTAEYALTTRVVFNYSVNGKRKLSGKSLSLTRDYTISDTQLLSSEGERRRLRTAMQQDLADLILTQIAASGNKPDSHSEPRD